MIILLRYCVDEFDTSKRMRRHPPTLLEKEESAHQEAMSFKNRRETGGVAFGYIHLQDGLPYAINMARCKPPYLGSNSDLLLYMESAEITKEFSAVSHGLERNVPIS
jgi:hypothetical protein